MDERQKGRRQAPVEFVGAQIVTEGKGARLAIDIVVEACGNPLFPSGRCLNNVIVSGVGIGKTGQLPVVCGAGQDQTGALLIGVVGPGGRSPQGRL